MMSSRLPLWILALLFSGSLSAQQFGGNPPSQKWRQIDIDAARVIFPAGLDSQAQQVAGIVHRLSSATLPTIGARLHKIDIVFQDLTTIPNGYVGLAPFRSEFQLTPDQNSFELGSLPWQKMLAIHEYRHVQQYTNFRVGLSRAFYDLFGEGGQALANSLAIPNWFWEGDAVFQETLVSDQGRGRIPYFFNGYRALWSGSKDYSWMKLRNGSLRDYVPDHYPLGFMLVAWGREKYGDAFWKKVTLDAAAFKGLFYPLQRAIEKYAGVSFARFRSDALEHFRQQSSTGSDGFARANKHFVSSQEFPQFMTPDNIVFMRSSYRQIPAFMVSDRKTGTEKILGARAVSLDNYFSYRNGRVVYAAFENDARWGWRDFSVIRLLDLSTGEDRRITRRTRYFSPDISADGRHIVTVLQAVDGACELHILDSRTGALEKKIPNPGALFYTYPKFYTDDQVVSAVRNTKGEMALALLNTGNGSADYLTPFSYNPIGFPSVRQDTIFFTATRDGRDRLFAYTRGQIYGLSFIHPFSTWHNRYTPSAPDAGLYEFSASGGQYAWTSFSAVGYRMAASDGSYIHLTPLPADSWNAPLLTQGIDSLDGHNAHLLDGIATGAYPTSRYPSSFRLFNFHSWRPYITDPDYTFSLVSENVLNTLQSEAYVDYNRNERYKQIGVDATYGALFPWIDVGGDYIFGRNTLTRLGTLTWNQVDAYGGLSIPLNLTRGRTLTGLQFGTDAVYQKDYFTGPLKDSVNDRSFTYLRNYISFYHQVQQVQQQIYPRFAQSLYVNFDRSLTGPVARQFLATGYFYLPGLAFTNSLVLGAAFQQRDQFNNGGFSNSFPFSRGYTAENFYRMWRLSANYHLPLAYPDWGIGNIVYFLRIRTAMFYDYMKASDFYRGNPYTVPFRSYGTEIYFDTKWWNQLPISFGIRYSRLLDPDYLGRGPNQWEFILPINLLGKY
jgi:hypothetical protein